MTCVLRAGGEAFDVDAFLAESPFEVEAIFRRGEPRLKHRPDGPKCTRSGFNVATSESDIGDLKGQVEGAIQFLERHSTELRRLMAFEGVEGAELNFAVFRREVPDQTHKFPSELLLRAGVLGLDIALSHYHVSEDD